MHHTKAQRQDFKCGECANRGIRAVMTIALAIDPLILLSCVFFAALFSSKGHRRDRVQRMFAVFELLDHYFCTLFLAVNGVGVQTRVLLSVHTRVLLLCSNVFSNRQRPWQAMAGHGCGLPKSQNLPGVPCLNSRIFLIKLDDKSTNATCRFVQLSTLVR